MLNLKKLTLTSAIIVSIGLLTACGDDDNGTTTVILNTNLLEDVKGCF